MRVPLAVAFVLFSACAFAQSQPPTPGARESQRSQPDSKSQSANQPTATDPRGTNESPLVVKVQPTPKTDEETAKEKAQEDDEASAKRWTKGLGVATGILGLLQLVAIGFQVSIAHTQNTIIKKQNLIMTGQRDAANTQSGYMRDGLIETRVAAQAAQDSAEAAKTQAAISLAQKRIGDRQLEQMSESLAVARMSAEAARESAATSVESAQIAKQTMIYSLRARIAYKKITTTNLGPNTDSYINVIIKNYGGKWA